MKKSTSIILIVLAIMFIGSLLLVALGLVIYGFSKLDQADTAIDKGTTSADERLYGEVFTSANDLFQLTAPPTWTAESDLNDQADLEIADEAAEQYAILFNEPTTDFAEDTTLEDYYDLVTADFETTINEVSLGQPQDIFINSYPAKQLEVSGVTDSKVKISYLITVVETPGYFHQIWAWTTTSNYTLAKDDLVDVTNSFMETSAYNVNPAY